MAEGGNEGRPTVTHPGGALAPVGVRRFILTVLEPPAAVTTYRSVSDRAAIGSAPVNDLIIDEPTVSRFHCEIQLRDDGAVVTDLHSRNGTELDGARILNAFLKDGSTLRMGAAAVRFQYGAETNHLPVSSRTSFGRLTGRSPVMRIVYSVLQHAAPTDATVLLEGETGTGKSLAAEAIHEESGRRNGPFVIVDCGAIPATLLEGELFGHEKGAFTGADARRIGAFEAASGGTVFLDEIGELPLDLQPKLLRVLETRSVRRLGSNEHRPVDVRIIVATNRDLRAEVNAGRFRSDLYFRLAVIKVLMPPLRSRPEDLPGVADAMLEALGADGEVRRRLLTPELIASLQRAAWPGNARELRNFLERCLIFRGPLPTGDVPVEPSRAVDPDRPYGAERQAALARFEREYVRGLLERHDHNVTRAAAAAGIARVHLHRLMRKHGLP